MNLAKLVITTMVVTLSCAASADGDPAAIIQHHVDAIARGDVESALALYAEDAVMDVQAPGGLCSAAPCVGKASIQKELERRVANKQAATIVKMWVSGDVVTFRSEVRNNAVRKSGGDRAVYWGIYEMKGDKISYVLTGVPQRSDPQTARYLEWMRSEQER